MNDVFEDLAAMFETLRRGGPVDLSMPIVLQGERLAR